MRSCLPCTECCRGAVETHTDEVNIDHGQPCPDVTDKGCGRGEDRPYFPCKSYQCGWLMNPQSLPEEMRPDICGAIINFDTVIRTKEGDIVSDDLIPTKEIVPEETKLFFAEYCHKNSRKLMIKGNIVENGKLYRTVIPIGDDVFVNLINKEARAKNPLTNRPSA